MSVNGRIRRMKKSRFQQPALFVRQADGKRDAFWLKGTEPRIKHFSQSKMGQQEKSGSFNGVRTEGGGEEKGCACAHGFFAQRPAKSKIAF